MSLGYYPKAKNSSVGKAQFVLFRRIFPFDRTHVHIGSDLSARVRCAFGNVDLKQRGHENECMIKPDGRSGGSRSMCWRRARWEQPGLEWQLKPFNRDEIEYTGLKACILLSCSHATEHSLALSLNIDEHWLKRQPAQSANTVTPAWSCLHPLTKFVSFSN